MRTVLDPSAPRRYRSAAMVLTRRPIISTLLFVIALTYCAACDNGIRVLNVAPEVTAIGPVSYEDGTAAITIWLYDYETDAVDVELYLLRNGVEEPLTNLGGDGLAGLTSSREPYGRAHNLVWSIPDSVSATDEIRLKAVPTDGDTGRATTTPGFTLDVGLTAP